MPLIKPPHPTRLFRLNPLPRKRYWLDEFLIQRIWRLASYEEPSLPFPSLRLFLSPQLSLRVFDFGFFNVHGVHVAFDDAGCDVLPCAV